MASMVVPAGLLTRWLPVSLPGIPLRIRPLLGVFWWCLFALATTALLGGSWRGYVEMAEVEQPLMDAALVPEFMADGTLGVRSIDRSLNEGGFPEIARIREINGKAVESDATPEAVGRAMRAAASPTRITVNPIDGGRTATVTTPKSRAFGLSMLGNQLTPLQYHNLMLAGSLISGAALLICAALLRLRRPNDSLSLLLSLSFLSSVMMLERPTILLWWIGAPWLGPVFDNLSIAFLIVAMPALPDGRFTPRTAALMLMAVTLHIGISGWDLVLDLTRGERLPDWLSVGSTYLFLFAALVILVVRYRRTTDPLQRQQLKWAAVGFLLATVLLLAVYAIDEGRAANWFTPLTRAWLFAINRAVTQVAYGLLAVGVLMSLLRYRLWDADAALGRSAVFVTLTLALGLIATVSAKLFEIGIENSFGDIAKPVIAVISTLSAALVLGPARTRFNRWMEQRLQPERIRLRKLPRLVQIWQHGDSAAELGDRVTGELQRLLHADRTALLVPDGSDGGYRVLAVQGTDSATVMAWADALEQSGGLPWTNGSDRRDPLFPVRSLVSDGDRLIALLLLGPRSDGSLFGTHELEALEALETPLAVALRHAERSEAHARALDARLARLEAAVARP